MQRLLKGYGLTPTSLASVLRVSVPTASSRLARPGTLTMEELYTISSRAHIPMDEIREAVKR